MKKIFRIKAQSETFTVPSQKAEGGQICNGQVYQDIVVNEIVKVNK